MIIGTCGFGSTGSSAVSDFLLEYGSLQVLDSQEFTWVSAVDGLVDLKAHLFTPHARTEDSINAIHRFEKNVKLNKRRYKRKYGNSNGEKFVQSAKTFIDSITQLKWNWYINDSTNFYSRYIKFLIIQRRIIPFIEKRLNRQINCYPMKEVRFSIAPQNFNEAAKQHVRDLLSIMGADFNHPIVLDQPFAGNNPQVCFEFFDDPYAIVVDRDPRDNYVFANTKLVGKLPHFMPIQPVEDFVKYYRALRDNQPYKKENERILRIKFEDLVYHYDETTAKIKSFLRLPDNPNPKSIFDPAISMPNTQLWKRFPQYAEDIKYIEQELSEYLFDFSGLPEPDINGKMFSGKSPKNVSKRNK